MSLTTPPGAEPLTLAEAKLWLRVDQSSEDTLITDLISAARLHFEAITGICCISQQWKVTFSQTPSTYSAQNYTQLLGINGITVSSSGREFVFPRAPLISVDNLQYLDSTGSLQTFASTNYTVGSVGSRNSFARLRLNDGCDWPSIGNFPTAIQITFTAGMFVNYAAVTSDIKQALRWLVAHYYENRMPVGVDDTLSEVPFSLRSYIESFRVGFIA